jgi:hypothetical protein
VQAALNLYLKKTDLRGHNQLYARRRGRSAICEKKREQKPQVVSEYDV